MQLRTATREDLNEVLSWFSTQETVQLWAGPSVRYPTTPAGAWTDIEGCGQSTHALVDSRGHLMAFGQAFLREEGIVHLARLAVHPASRGKGIGRSLCQALVEQAVSAHRVRAFTLKVYASNEPALHLYRSLGFEQRDGKASTGAMVMIKRVAGE